VSFAIERGEFVCIIGHSGCGKTTILNILAGLEEASSGIRVHGRREVRGPSLDRGVVFQGHALMPWLSVLQNIAFAVQVALARLEPRPDRRAQPAFIALVGLAGAEDKKPANCPAA
jgi:nitrate/nitrite transport system ATP-binding protein